MRDIASRHRVSFDQPAFRFSSASFSSGGSRSARTSCFGCRLMRWARRCRLGGVASQQWVPCHHRCSLGNFARASLCVMQEGDESAGVDDTNAIATPIIATRIGPLH
jgi:hypothetical protein